jgi:hypothetical protein
MTAGPESLMLIRFHLFKFFICKCIRTVRGVSVSSITLQAKIENSKKKAVYKMPFKPFYEKRAQPSFNSRTLSMVRWFEKTLWTITDY